jgi:hypothetical protein
MVRSCSIIIYSVYVLYDVSINEAVSQKPKVDLKRKEKNFS